jgi:hypothetical protein
VELGARAINSSKPLNQEPNMEQVIAESVARKNFNMALLSVFAGIALLLSSAWPPF